MTSALDRHDELVGLRRGHPAWRLLGADNAPLTLGFLERVFLTPNVRQMPGPDLADALADHLTALRRADPAAYPKEPEAYIADWSEPSSGWLRRWYPGGSSDVPLYAPTAAVETAAAFVRSLRHREFLGTASRLLTVRDLLRQITVGAASDPQVRLEALQRQRDEVDAQISALRSGEGGTLDDTAIRERFAQAVSTARDLLGDLREVEENFRALDRDVRLRATTWTGPRGEFLRSVFGSTAEIGKSDQGRSWEAFWEHMLSARQQDELDGLLRAVASVPALDGRSTQIESLLREELFSAAESTQRTVAALSGQLRRFLDERSWTESRRIHELIRSTLAAALDTGSGGDPGPVASVPELRVDVALPLERPLFTGRTTTRLDSSIAEPDAARVEDLAALFELSAVDLDGLRLAVAVTVERCGGVATLAQVVDDHPLSEGLAELIGYLQVADDGAQVIPDTRQQVDWIDAEGRRRMADIPLVVFGPAGGQGLAPQPQKALSPTVVPPAVEQERSA
ncbi:MAG TPA: DUF3375 domain-containing protein [Propionibacteriaceae bacterium]|nr:DUF3375 domain-containing protein [Propionibacteriaceae bacterium]